MQLHCMHLLSIWSCRAFMLHLQSIHVKFHLHSKHSSAQHLRLFFFLLLFLLGVTDSVVFMLLWFAALPAIVGLAGGLCFCCCRRRCCWRCHGGSFSFCGVDALMVWCFASQCWTCWRLVFLLLSSSLSVGDVIVRVSDSAVCMLLWFAALPAIVGLAGGLCFCCCRRRCCWRCLGESFSFCGVDALMVWCFASQCWTCWRLVFLLLLLLLLLMLFLFQCFRCRLVPMFMCCESCIHSRHCLQFEMHREHLSLFQFAVQKLSE